MQTRSTRSRCITRVLFLLTLAAVLGITACSSLPREHWWQFWRSKPTQTAGAYNLPDQVEVPIPPADSSDASRSGTAMGVPPGGVVDTDPLRQRATEQVALRTIHFNYDRADISSVDRAILDANAQWLLANPAVQIQIQGHCDERGTTEYNFNLGDRRAKAVKAYLMQKGVQADRIHTTSFGKDHPVDTSGTEQAHAKNRRAQFLVY